MPLDDEQPISPEFRRRAAEWDAKHDTPIEQEPKKEAYGFDPSNFPTIATKEEADRLRGSRVVPLHEPHFTIGGEIQKKIDSRYVQESEERIEFLNDKLENRAQKFERDFEKSRGDNEPEL